MFFTNKRRDKKYGPANKESSNEAGMQDKTEFENKDFRYVLWGIVEGHQCSISIEKSTDAKILY